MLTDRHHVGQGGVGLKPLLQRGIEEIHQADHGLAQTRYIRQALGPPGFPDRIGGEEFVPDDALHTTRCAGLQIVIGQIAPRQRRIVADDGPEGWVLPFQEGVRIRRGVEQVNMSVENAEHGGLPPAQPRISPPLLYRAELLSEPPRHWPGEELIRPLVRCVSRSRGVQRSGELALLLPARGLRRGWWPCKRG